MTEKEHNQLNEIKHYTLMIDSYMSEFQAMLSAYNKIIEAGVELTKQELNSTFSSVLDYLHNGTYPEGLNDAIYSLNEAEENLRLIREKY